MISKGVWVATVILWLLYRIHWRISEKQYPQAVQTPPQCVCVCVCVCVCERQLKIKYYVHRWASNISPESQHIANLLCGVPVKAQNHRPRAAEIIVGILSARLVWTFINLTALVLEGLFLLIALSLGSRFNTHAVRNPRATHPPIHASPPTH